MKNDVRGANIYFNLEKLRQLTEIAMANITAEYWRKCIAHQEKEIYYYLKVDNQMEGVEDIPVVIYPLEIPVSNFTSLYPSLSLIHTHTHLFTLIHTH